jgi:cell shape-determining protein MreC
MFDEKGFLKNSKSFFLLLIFFSVFLLFFNFLGIQKKTVDSITFLTGPVDSAASASSESVKNFFGVFGEVRTLRSEYYDLQEEYLELKAEKNMMSLLKEENLTLKEQLNLENEQENLILAEVLFQDLALRDESLLINKGSRDGLSEGDIALIGRMYVGIVIEVHGNTSKVRLPTSRASSLKVMIFDNNDEFGSEFFEPKNFLSGVAIGQANVLKIENIETRGNLEEGYTILTNDQKIGTYLYLGNVLTIDEDPTATLRGCSVELPIDYSNLKRIFVRKGGDI